MVPFGGKNGLANFRLSELQNSARQKNKFPTLFKKSVMFGLRFFAFTVGLK